MSETREGCGHQEEPSPDDHLALRYLLWIRHGCPFSALYGDDGEMQCNACRIDFKRTPALDITRRFMEMGAAAARAQP